MRVVIVGAGLGGLCLAHGLQAAGIEVVVLERSASSGAHPASYGIHLNAEGLRALHDALPADNWQQLVDAATTARNLIRFHDARGGILATLNFETAEHALDPVTRRRAIGREGLRAALLRGLSTDDGPPAGRSGIPVVRWRSRFVGYNLRTDGQVEVRLDDGTTVCGDVLVGADGSNSRVRGQRLPELQRHELGVLNVAGRVPLTSAVAERLTPELRDSAINNIVPAGPGWLFVSTWGAGGADRSAVWAWAARADTYPGHGAGLTGAELKQHVARNVSTWSAPVRALVDATDPAAVGPVPLRSMPVLPEWEPSRVTLLGDAVHSMTPMGGVGANTALRDAQTLASTLTRNPEDPVAAVAEYERRMRGYANPAIEVSRRNAVRASNPSRPARTVFRTVLRAAERSPRIKQRIFHTPAELQQNERSS